MRISIQQAASLLKEGHIVAIPTETVYGLAAFLFSENAIKKVYAIKNRPASNPLIIHVKNKEECLKYIETPPPFFDLLADTFWPGPLTLILPVKKELIPSIARSDLTTSAFRVPKSQVALELLENISPLVAPSANLSGKPSATREEHIEEDFGKDFPLIAADLPEHGVESTILAYKDGAWQLARHGAITQDALEKVLGYRPCEYKKTSTPICPGQLFRHYAPKAHLVLSENPSCDFVVGYSDRSYPHAKKVFLLGSSQNPEEVAHNLYETLRRLDREQILEAEVDINIPKCPENKLQGLWKTIIERLYRAANQ